MIRYRPLLCAALAVVAVSGCSRQQDLALNPDPGARMSAERAADVDPVPVGTAAGATLVVLSENGMLLTVDAADPSRVTSRRKISGLSARTRILGIDFRPATGQLYGLGSNSRLYTIDLTTGATSAVGAGFTPALSGEAFGFDFNPTVDRIRVVSNTGQNLRLHPDTGALAAVDSMLRFNAPDVNGGRTPGVAGAGYTNSDTDPGTGTLLYDIDATHDVLVTQVPPNNGVLNTVGPLGVDAEGLVGFDIALIDGVNVAYAAHKGSGNGASAEGGEDSAAHLVRIDLMTGAATDLGKIHGAGRVTGLAVRP
jgi:hypothetical protein